jgi:hypothetical protein
MEPTFSLLLNVPEETKQQVLQSTDRLRDLCKQEVSRFSDYVSSVDPQFRKCPLSKEERLAIEGYLYQKSKGHLDAFCSNKNT